MSLERAGAFYLIGNPYRWEAMRALRIALLLSALLVLWSRPLSAQVSDPREGLWWGLGLDYGWVNVSCDICDGSRGAGLSATARLGGTISQSLLLGGEVNGWTNSEEGVDEYLGSFSAVALWYLTPDGSFYLKGGFGYMSYRIDDEENALTSSGFGPQVGAGYEFRVSRSFSIQPYMNAIITLPTGNLDFNGDREASEVSLGLFQVGLGVTWH